MKHPVEGLGLVGGRVQRIEGLGGRGEEGGGGWRRMEEEAASLKELLLGEQSPSPGLSRSSSLTSILMVSPLLTLLLLHFLLHLLLLLPLLLLLTLLPSWTGAPTARPARTCSR